MNKNKLYNNFYLLSLFNIGLITIIDLIITSIIRNIMPISVLAGSYITGYYYTYKLKKKIPDNIALGTSILTAVVLILISFIMIHYLVFENEYAELFDKSRIFEYLMIIFLYFLYLFMGSYIMLKLGSSSNRASE
ncbi:hypothetical protein HYX06_00370 [Candidatus Woesearchaeota archaeon]|nr:hypothetical protein [Candidatus Woesearchaeota archaeon]